MTEKMRFGGFFKQRRMKLGLTLREFCRRNNVDPGNFSRMERDELPPPRGRDVLENYANMLEIKRGTDEWYTFFDLAAAETGRIPQDILDDERLLRKLPVLFRTLRGQRIPEEQLDELVRKLRSA